jgi:signal transduction histidine kinase
MLLRLINDILEASSINDGPQSIEPVDVDFAKSFNDIFHTLEQRVQAPNVEFIEDNPCDSLPTHLDIGRIQQVITNFVINATKYTTAGHIKIGYKRKTGKGENNEDVNGLYVYCEDTGSGIPKDKQAYIFERFVKLNEFVQGTGLGLSICKSIAERCGGHIGVDSEGEGQGSTFWIWIPCPQPTTNAKSQDSYATK